MRDSGCRRARLDAKNRGQGGALCTGITTPEDVLGGREQASLSIRLKCNRCGRGYSGKFAWVCYNPKRVPEHPEWDGLLLSRIVECAGCGAIDDYTLTPQTKLRLMGDALGRMDGSREAPVILGVSTLWDGSIARRPSQALERLRALVAENPSRAEAHRRLGNACERWSLKEAGVVLWALRDARNGPKIKASIFSWGPELDRTSEEALSAIFTYILSVSEHLSAEDLRSAVRSVAPQAEDVVMTAAEQLIEKGRAEGLARGRAEVLVRQLTLRFGPLPPGTKERVLSASDAELDRWSELVLTAKSIVEVLDG